MSDKTVTINPTKKDRIKVHLDPSKGFFLKKWEEDNMMYMFAGALTMKSDPEQAICLKLPRESLK